MFTLQVFTFLDSIICLTVSGDSSFPYTALILRLFCSSLATPAVFLLAIVVLTFSVSLRKLDLKQLVDITKLGQCNSMPQWQVWSSCRVKRHPHIVLANCWQWRVLLWWVLCRISCSFGPTKRSPNTWTRSPWRPDSSVKITMKRRWTSTLPCNSSRLSLLLKDTWMKWIIHIIRSPVEMGWRLLSTRYSAWSLALNALITGFVAIIDSFDTLCASAGHRLMKKIGTHMENSDLITRTSYGKNNGENTIPN